MLKNKRMRFLSQNEDALGWVIQKLRAGNGHYVSSQTLVRESGFTRAAIWKQIQQLRQFGYRIAASPRLGYRLLRSPDLLLPFEVWPHLTTQNFGRRFLYRASVPSTNTVAVQFAAAGVPEGLIVATENQTAGRGRLGRTWRSPPRRNLLFSLLLRPAIPLEQAASLPLLLALALRRTLRNLFPFQNPVVKWPNDLLIQGRKIAGILCEMQAEPDHILYLIAGIGFNVNMTRNDFPKELRTTATSLRIVTGAPHSRPMLLALFLNTLEPLYAEWRQIGFSPFLDEYRYADALFGHPVRIRQSDRILEGQADGIEPDGALRVRTASGSLSLVHSGDAHLLATPVKFAL